MLLKHIALATAPAILGRRRFERLAALFARVAALDLAASRTRQLASFPGAALFDRDSLMRAVFSAYYSDSDPNLIVPAEAVPSAASFVPYYRGFTSVVLYNFFRMNYGIRDPILYRCSIFSGREAVWSRQHLAPADGVVVFEDPAIQVASLPANGSFVIEAFHPKVATPARQLRFFGIYRDLERQTIAGTHSLALGRIGLPRLAQPSFRGYGCGDVRYFHHSAAANRSPLRVRSGSGALRKLLSESGVVAEGYMTMDSAAGCPAAIWHDGPTPHFVRGAGSGKALGAAYTAFFVPDFRTHAPLVLISSSQIGFQPRGVTVHLQAEDGRTLARREVAIQEDNATLDLKAEFGDTAHTGGANVVLEFDRDIGEFQTVPTSYVHVYYRSRQGMADQVHSHSTLGYREDPNARPRPYRCRKFAPFLKDPRLEFVYSIVNLGPGVKAVHDDTIRLRVFSDRGSEFVLTRRLSSAGITNIRGAELLEGLPLDIEAAAVVQIEHETTNFNGSWYALDRSSGHLAVDHFTGG